MSGQGRYSMDGTRSHGKGWKLARGFAFAGAIAVPVAFALGGSFLLGRGIFRAGQIQAQTMRIQEVRAQSRLLLENVWASLENVKIRASSHFANPAFELDRGIESVAPIAGIPEKALMKQIRQAGIGVVPLSKALGLVFFASKKDGHPALVLAKVNPTRIFSSFGRWATRREAGRLRGYLIASDGRVLVHSESVYTGSDFSGIEVFQTALRSLFRGERVSGIATYTGADLRPSLTSYVGVGILPLAVVVERVVRPAGALAVRQNAVPGAVFLAALLFLCGLSYIAIRKLAAIQPGAIAVPELEPELNRVALASDLRRLERERIRRFSEELSQAGIQGVRGDADSDMERPEPLVSQQSRESREP